MIAVSDLHVNLASLTKPLLSPAVTTPPDIVSWDFRVPMIAFLTSTMKEHGVKRTRDAIYLFHGQISTTYLPKFVGLAECGVH